MVQGCEEPTWRSSVASIIEAFTLVNSLQASQLYLSQS